MLTQDNCTHAAYSRKWVAINGKPLTNQYFYDAPHLAYGDLSPGSYYLGKTLGSSVGAGIAFHDVKRRKSCLKTYAIS